MEHEVKDTYSWYDMLDDFRRLGGVAENIEQRVGKHGNGIFAIDPQKPVHIEVPKPLLVSHSDFRLEGNDLIISPDAPVSDEIKIFYRDYHKHFSWGATEGRKNAEAFELGLKTLPDRLLKKLKEMNIINLDTRHAGSWDELVMRRFLSQRTISFQNQSCCMPVMELVNHDPLGAEFAITNSVKLAGSFEHEVTVKYNTFSDSLRRFLGYGFANQERRAYSLPMVTKFGDMTLQTDMNPASIVLDGMSLPKMDVLPNNVRKLSHLVLGAEGNPKIPKTFFRKTVNELPAALADELFEKIRGYNQFVLCEMLEMLDMTDTPFANEFRRAIIFQIKSLSFCFGVLADE